MSPEILFPAIALGIMLILVVVNLLTRNNRPSLLSDQEAISRYLQDFPRDQVENVRMASDKHSATLLLKNGDVGFVYAFGGKYITRRFLAEEAETELRKYMKK